MRTFVIHVSKVSEATVKDQIPGLKFNELSCLGAKQCKRVRIKEGKSTQELRRLAYDFPKELPVKHLKAEKPENEKSKESLGKTRNWDPHDNWGKENVDFRVRRVLLRSRVLKQGRKKDRVESDSKEQSKAGKSLGKFGRGDPPHEFWEEERRLREKKRKERLAKEKKKKERLAREEKKKKRLAKEEEKSGPGCPEEEGLPSSGSPGAGPDFKNLSSNNVINLSPVNPMIENLIDDQGTGVDFKDLGVNKVTNNYHEVRKQITCLMSNSESDVGEEDMMPEVRKSDGESDEDKVLKDVKDRGSEYFKDWESNKVLNYNKDPVMLYLGTNQSDLKLIVDDIDSQCGDHESEEEEEKKKRQRGKILPGGRGGASQWEELAEEERSRMVAIMRKKMVTIAVEVHIQGIPFLSYHSFYRLLLTRISRFVPRNQTVQQETVSLSPLRTNASSSTVAGLSQASPF